jgi:beta-galactosidase
VRGYLSAYDDNYPVWAATAEKWWGYFADRPWLSGGFVWTGFDYRGEPTPYAWPCINSHFGILDTCGFPKDNFYYYQAWWTTNIVLHLLPHWNWPGKEGQTIRVDVFSNCREVELFLNGKSLGRQKMGKNSKLTWQVTYEPGTLSAKGYDDGKVVAEAKVETTGDAVSLRLTPDRSTITADGCDVSVITVSALDAQGRSVPVAQNMVHFDVSGAGRIIGVGNGDPSCHEPDTFVAEPKIQIKPVNDWRFLVMPIPLRGDPPDLAETYDDSSWKGTSTAGDNYQLAEGQAALFRRHFPMTPQDFDNAGICIRFGSIDDRGIVYVNGKPLGESSHLDDSPVFEIKKLLHPGDNVIAVALRNEASRGGVVHGVTLEMVNPGEARSWTRSLFNGLAEIIVQSSHEAGQIKLTASADGLAPTSTTIQSAEPMQLVTP